MTAYLNKPKLLVLVGPTAVGKTKLSLSVAQQFQCEIISGDSMQVYRGMDVGTAKASAEEQQVVPHHMIDIHDPDQPFSVAEFQESCKQLIPEIHQRGKLPFIVGGTGLYVESVCYNYQFSEVSGDEAIREQYQTFADTFGEEALHTKLKAVDPGSAERIHQHDVRRTIRALEVYHVTGKTMSAHLEEQKKESPFDLCIIGLTMDRTLLYKRIEERIDGMMRQGLVAEVQRLLEQGYSQQLVSMQGLGYKEIIAYLNGEYGLEKATELLKRNTRRFAKRQLSWFRHMKDIQWVDVTNETNFPAHLHTINAIIAGKLHADENN